MFLRVPGLGARSVDRILLARRHTRLRLADIGRLARSLKRVRPFLIAADWRPVALADKADVRPAVTSPVTSPVQGSLF
jgi:predicted DNA-binding helix-hairpin-helix protein